MSTLDDVASIPKPALEEFKQFFWQAFEQFMQARGGKSQATHATADVIRELLEAKTRANRRAVYITSLRQYLARFAGRHPELTTVTSADVEDWLAQFTSPASRQSHLNRISVLFSFAVRRGYLEKNPCDRVERVSIDRKSPAILTPEQACTLLASCPANCKPYLVLAMYSGIRPAEIERLRWADVDLETCTVRVDGKTRRRRIVPLEPIAVRLLSKFTSRNGRVTPANITLRRWRRRARKLIGGKWAADILRHTAASYLLAKYKDPAKVAYSLGNSPNVLLTHYHCPVGEKACREFWGE